MPEKPKTELERYWKERWWKAKLDLDAARAHVESLKSDSASGPDGSYAHARAMVDETAVLIEYSRVLRIYTDLMVHGKLPDDPNDRKAANAKSEGQ